MVDVKPVSGSDSKRLSGSNLALRILSALVLGPLALLTAWVGAVSYTHLTLPTIYSV